jgi:hypothetical protein
MVIRFPTVHRAPPSASPAHLGTASHATLIDLSLLLAILSPAVTAEEEVVLRRLLVARCTVSHLGEPSELTAASQNRCIPV